MKKPTDTLPVNLQRRRLLCAAGALLISPLAHAGAQREETLADDVASVMRSSVGSVNPPRLVFDNPKEGERWLSAMSARLARFVPDEGERRRLLVNIQYESSRAGLDTQIVLGLIEVESAFRQYAISGVGARGLMQVMPFGKTTSANRRTTCSISVPTCVTAAPSCAITETLKRATSSAHLPASTAASAAINIRTPFGRVAQPLAVALI
ncbi:transglycosylase [Neisseria gonorrhoeae]|uniref:Transglycosylase n=1 Tax=Neisseria gonorrhoeae TaxID=485 RepID=A0A378VVQ7_NEIGO|nr:transglycosylase [Neisseria gonorrhoeae]